MSIAIRRLDDYQSWMIEAAGKRVAVDPWLRDELVLPPGRWMFRRHRKLPDGGPEAIKGVDALVLSAPFGDHCDPATLAVLSRQTPVYANAQAIEIARGLGFTNLHTLRDSQRTSLFDGLDVEPVAPGFPYTKDSLGFIFHAEGKRIYLETHVVDLSHRSRLTGLDVAIMPVQGVWLLGLALAMSPARALAVIQALRPKRVVPTGSDPQNADGFMSRFLLFYKGGIDEFGRRMRESSIETEFMPLGTGETLTVS